MKRNEEMKKFEYAIVLNEANTYTTLFEALPLHLNFSCMIPASWLS